MFQKLLTGPKERKDDVISQSGAQEFVFPLYTETGSFSSVFHSDIKHAYQTYRSDVNAKGKEGYDEADDRYHTSRVP